MKREIKFKAKRIDNDEWVTGYYVEIPTGHGRIYCQPFIEASSNTWFYVDKETVCQLVGKNDSGIEFYYGDILTSNKYPYQDEGKRNYDAVIDWMFHGFQLVLKLVNENKSGISDGINQGEIECFNGFEVIGNIND